MWGKETLAMLVSSTSMKVASVTVSAIIHGFTAGGVYAALVGSVAAAASLISPTPSFHPQTVFHTDPISPRPLFHPDLGLHRHTQTQRVILILTRLKYDFRGYALHNFYVIARGIFGRQKAEARARCARNALDMAFVLAGKGVDGNSHALPWVHMGELSFLEIGGDPYIVQGHNRQQRLPGLHVHANFHIFVHDAAHRRSNRAVLQIQFGLREGGAFFLDCRE